MYTHQRIGLKQNKIMISCNLQGGLGNQMFQISATYALSLRNNDTCCFNFNQCYTPLQGKPSSNYRNNVFINIVEDNDYKPIVGYTEPKFGYKELPYTSGLILNGYFQSEKYFSDYKNEVKKLFIVDKNNAEKFLNTIKKDNLTVTSIHIRRGDYVNLSDMHSLCTLEYFQEAMDIIGKSIFVIVSDDLEWAKENVKGDMIYYSPFQNELDDLAIIMCCDNNIISNSSFSWWGAYLNENTNKRVIAPKLWFGPRGPKDTEDIIPSTWVKR
jgi:hypothetical protein